jgi:hypothetical protein
MGCLVAEKVWETEKKMELLRLFVVFFWEKMKNPPQFYGMVVFGLGKINNLISGILISCVFTLYMLLCLLVE